MWAYNLMVINIIRSKKHIFVENNNNNNNNNNKQKRKKEILFPNYF